MAELHIVIYHFKANALVFLTNRGEFDKIVDLENIKYQVLIKPA